MLVCTLPFGYLQCLRDVLSLKSVSSSLPHGCFPPLNSVLQETPLPLGTMGNNEQAFKLILLSGSSD